MFGDSRYVVRLAIIILLLTLFIGTASAEIWYVDDDSGADFTKIQDAIDAAVAGDTIIVKDGTYHENVDVYERLIIRSENGSVSTTVIASNPEDHVFGVFGNYVNISGFTIEGATGSWIAGIYLKVAYDCNISGNIASNNSYGIYLDRFSGNNRLVSNIVSGNHNGIRLYSSYNNTLTGNMMLDNTHSLGVYSPNLYDYYGSSYGSSLPDYTQNIDNTNKVNGKPVYYLVDKQDQVISDDAGYVGVVNSTNITVKDLTLTGNRQGVLFVYTNNSKIENVNVSNNHNGIYLESSSNNTLTGNIVKGNNHNGIYLESSSNNTLTGNIANSNNGDGIYLFKSKNNSLVNNTANSNNNYGIHLWNSRNSTLLENNMSGNGYNLYVLGSILCDYYGSSYGSILLGYTQNIDNTNKVNGKQVYYLVDKQDQVIPDDAGYVGVVNSTNIIVKNLTLTGNRQGVLFVYTNNSKIENVNVSNNHNGIYLESSSNNTLMNNTAKGNNCGIMLRYSINNTIEGNNATNNNYGIYLENSRNNTIYNNYFNNTKNAFDIKNNIWNITKTAGTNIIGGPYLGGNYWSSDYKGADTDGDGLGDTLFPHNSSGLITNSGDYHPLMKTWIPTPTPTPTPTSTSTPSTPDEEQPGFEAIFAIIGLLVIAYLVRRRK
ncbi:MAG: NosD domain-containing protein [Halobacteriota archaeon]|nr:NosD domain-containing protein [Halobacteriota archaeon]